jgi:hypothetical protein
VWLVLHFLEAKAFKGSGLSKHASASRRRQGTGISDF